MNKLSLVGMQLPEKYKENIVGSCISPNSKLILVLLSPSHARRTKSVARVLIPLGYLHPGKRKALAGRYFI